MCKFIGVEILAANALIDILESEKGRTITFSKLNKYGIEVIKYLENNFKEQSVILYNGGYIGNRILDYSEYFNINTEGNAISVNEGVTSEQLRKKFRTPLAYELLKAILSENAKAIINS